MPAAMTGFFLPVRISRKVLMVVLMVMLGSRTTPFDTPVALPFFIWM